AWDLGNPAGRPKKVRTPVLFVEDEEAPEHHPMKGPMVTQTFQSMIGSNPFHWRGDIVDFEEFNMTFVNLIGRDETLSNPDFNEFQSYLTSIAYPPNPYRTLDNGLPEELPLPGHYSTGRFSSEGTPLPHGNAQRGLALFKERPHARLNNRTCFDCHQQTSGLGEILSPESRASELIPVHFDGEESETRITVAQVTQAHVTESGHTLSALVGSQQKPFKVAQLRNLFDKSGFTTLPGQPSLSGFGFSHDGSIDSIERFVSLQMFDLRSDQEVADLTAMLLTFTGNNATEVERASWSGQSFSSETHSATGSQVTLVAESGGDVRHRSARLLELADRGEIDVVARATMNGTPRGWLYAGDGVFQSDEARGGMDFGKLVSLAGSPVTLTALHRGTGRRIGIDRDRDKLLDYDEIRDLAPLVPGIQNPFDPARADVSGDHYDVLPDGVPDHENDFDGDGITNGEEIDAGTNPVDNWVEDTSFRVYLTAGAAPDVFFLNWPGRPFRNYRVEISYDLIDWIAAPEGSFSTLASEKVLQYRVRERKAEGERRRYFRVVDVGATGPLIQW
ncbi:MAG: thrombospondin type 3 repeat-containing protein, partial [Verrucomicrobiota bacterium]